MTAIDNINDNTDINDIDIRNFYEQNVYGVWRSGEEVTYDVLEKSKRVVIPDPSNPFATMFKLSTTDEGRDIEINVSANGKTVTFTVRAYLPSAEAASKYHDGCPFIVCMHPIMPKDYALSQGYALIFMDTSMVAEDNMFRKGCFYDLYPYGDDPSTQTGELMAWSWEAAKVLDAVYSGLGAELGLNAEEAMITGVSRWGKATAVCGAFEKRFRYVVPTCSGAGGLALWGYQSEGKTYDLTCCGAEKEYTYGQNEPLSCLQSEAERGWFVDRFLQYKTYGDIPVEQYMLPALAADPKRHYYIVAAWTKEDWVNAPAMWECYEKAKEIYTRKGLADHIKAFFHKEGHAVLREDLEQIFADIDMAKK